MKKYPSLNRMALYLCNASACPIYCILFHTYIEANRAFIPNYGDRYRRHETISTAFVESTVNYLVSKCFVKKQQMRWNRRGAYLLLQTRVQVLNGDLRKTFCRWFYAMKADEPVLLKEAA